MDEESTSLGSRTKKACRRLRGSTELSTYSIRRSVTDSLRWPLDPIEADNRWHDPAAAEVFAVLVDRLAAEAERQVPTRNEPWPYAGRNPTAGPPRKRVPPPARGLRKLLQRAGMHRTQIPSVSGIAAAHGLRRVLQNDNVGAPLGCRDGRAHRRVTAADDQHICCGRDHGPALTAR